MDAPETRKEGQKRKRRDGSKRRSTRHSRTSPSLPTSSSGVPKRSRRATPSCESSSSSSLTPAAPVCSSPGREYGIQMDLLLAADAGDLDLVRALMRQPGADVNKAFFHPKFNGKSRALHYATRSGHLAVVRALVEEFGADINTREREDWTPVYYAANNGHTDIVEYLVEKGADVRVRDNFNCRSPLEVAKYRQFHDIVGILNEAESRQPPKPEVTGTEGRGRRRRAKAVGQDDGHYIRSAEQIETEGRKKVFKGVHKKHMDLFLGRYKLGEGIPALITEFREFTANDDISYEALDTVLQLQVNIRHCHDRERHTEECQRLRQADGNGVVRSSVLSTNEFMLVTVQ